MARQRKTTYIEIEGPLFDAVESGRIKDALAGAIEDLAVEGADHAQDTVRGAGFVRTGRFVSGIGVELVRSRGAGYAKVTMVDPGAAYPTPNRPTRTFMEYGTRGGVKLRTANYAFRKAGRALNKLRYPAFEAALVRALE